MIAPLNHLKILDFSTLLPGPYATMMLADLGADVIRIEAPNRPDLARLLPPHGADGQSAQHALLNRGKRSLGLNLKEPTAVEIVQKLVTEQGYDIIVEQFRPGVMERLGVGYTQLKEICPQLIFCSLTGYGQTGPYKDRAGHDLNYLALSGLLSYYGRKSAVTPPPPLPIQVADIGAGSLHLVIGLLTAVIRRTQTGEGGQLDISMFDGALAWNALGASKLFVGGENPTPESELLNGGTFYDIYETADGRLIAVGSLEPKFWQGFCHAIGRDDLIAPGLNYDIANQQSFKDEIRQAIYRKPLAAWRTTFADLDVCVEPVLTTEEALNHPQTKARNMILELPDQSGNLQKQIASPIKLSGHTPGTAFSGVPLGWHSVEILSQIGYTKDEIGTLFAQNVVAGQR
ncbi:CaiB/BaiF CoA transferase family protein [Candidatus Leptofilum sp.]|uniref:CaiB/BaiF CoA transferase family protein n=1 Tax=Candidatus Leptofilum sp. TaxID=3241576 RepID=UPI003B593105